MEKIIFRKFFYDLLTFFLIVSLSLTLIIWIIQSVNYLDLISNDGHGFKVYFSFISLNFPKIYSRIIIFSYFISIFFVIQKYQLNNEILIFWTNGISKLNVVNFLVKLSLIFTIFQIFFVYSVVPKSQDFSRDFIRTSNIDLFTSLISEKKFIDTLKDFTIFVEDIDDNGNFKNIYIKDSLNTDITQVITATSGKIVEKNSNKYLNLKYGQILDVSNNDLEETKIIKFTETTFNISKFKTKTTTFPKIQELKSSILLSCIENFFIGNKNNYTLVNFQCSLNSSIKSAKEIFNRSIKQLYLLVIALVASILIYSNIKNPNYIFNRIVIFSCGLFFIIFSELNSEFIDSSALKSIVITLFPVIFFLLTYFYILNLNKKNL